MIPEPEDRWTPSDVYVERDTGIERIYDAAPAPELRRQRVGFAALDPEVVDPLLWEGDNA